MSAAGIDSQPTLFLPQPYILTVDKTLQSAALGFLCPHYAAHAVSSRENQFCKFSCQLFHFSTLNFSCQLFPAHVNWVLPPTRRAEFILLPVLPLETASNVLCSQLTLP